MIHQPSSPGEQGRLRDDEDATSMRPVPASNSKGRVTDEWTRLHVTGGPGQTPQEIGLALQLGFKP